MSGEQNSTENKDAAAVQQEVMQNLLLANLKEQRRHRRWGIFFKSLTFLYLFMLFFTFFPGGGQEKAALSPGKHTSLIDIDGVIAANTEANAETIMKGLRAAFEDKKTAGIIFWT